jgi:hypothetical protein
VSRYYLTQRAPSFALWGPREGTWDAGDRRSVDPVVWGSLLSTSKAGGGQSYRVQRSTLGDQAQWLPDISLHRFVTPPLAAQTISGTFDLCVAVYADEGADAPYPDIEARWHVHIWATVGDTNVVRGVLLDDFRDSAGTTWDHDTYVFTDLSAPAALTPVAVQAGDHLVVEIGAVVGVEADSLVALYYGTTTSGGVELADAGPDDYGMQTTRAPWFDFSATITEQAAPAAPDNEDSAYARAIATLPYTDGPYDTSAATSTAHTVWYTWTAPSAMRVFFSTFGPEGTTYSGQVTVRRDSATGTIINFSTANGQMWSQRNQAVVMWNALNGVTYFISIASIAYRGDTNGACVADCGGQLAVAMYAREAIARGDVIVSCQHIARYRDGVFVDNEGSLYGYTPTAQAIDYSLRPMTNISDLSVNTDPRLLVSLFDDSPWIEVLDLDRFGQYACEIDFLSLVLNGQYLCSLVTDMDGKLYAGWFGDNYDVIGILATPSTCRVNVTDALYTDSGAWPAAALHTVEQDLMGSDFIDLAGDLDTLYYTSAGQRILRYSLGTTMQLADFAVVAVGDGVRPGLRSIRLLPTGGLLACNGSQVVRLDGNGLLVQTYTPTGSRAPYGSLDKVELAPSVDPDDPTTVEEFWVSDQLATTLFKFNLATGAQTLTLDTGLPQGQLSGFSVYYGYHAAIEGQVLAPPTRDITGTGTVTWQGLLAPSDHRLIRRLRQSPHLSTEQVLLFIDYFQLDVEAGIGLSEGQGVDPQIMLQWSDDGGHTWSNEHWTSAGRQGQYQRRALWRRLGRTRDRVWRVVVSDPCRWVFLDAFMGVKRGTS